MSETQKQTPQEEAGSLSKLMEDLFEPEKKEEKKAPAEKTAPPKDSGYRPHFPAVTLKEVSDDIPFQESMKTLRTNIEFSGAEDEVKVVCVTSALPNDGKSTISYNLARAFAESGKKTLLIDADMRKSVMRKQIVKAGGTSDGLSNFLVGRASYEDSLCVTSVKNLYIMFAGTFPPNPSELLGSARFRQLIDGVKKVYSVVVIDTPPIGSVIDAAVTAKVSDGLVLVLRSGSVSYRFAKRCREQLEATGTKILGCVLNDVDMHSGKYYGNYYGKYYGAYYGK